MPDSRTVQMPTYSCIFGDCEVMSAYFYQKSRSPTRILGPLSNFIVYLSQTYPCIILAPSRKIKPKVVKCLSRNLRHSVDGDDIGTPVPKSVGLPGVILLACELHQHVKPGLLDDKAHALGIGVGPGSSVGLHTVLKWVNKITDPRAAKVKVLA